MKLQICQQPPTSTPSPPGSAVIGPATGGSPSLLPCVPSEGCAAAHPPSSPDPAGLRKLRAPNPTCWQWPRPWRMALYLPVHLEEAYWCHQSSNKAVASKVRWPCAGRTLAVSMLWTTLVSEQTPSQKRDPEAGSTRLSLPMQRFSLGLWAPLHILTGPPLHLATFWSPCYGDQQSLFPRDWRHSWDEMVPLPAAPFTFCLQTFPVYPCPPVSTCFSLSFLLSPDFSLPENLTLGSFFSSTWNSRG